MSKTDDFLQDLSKNEFNLIIDLFKAFEYDYTVNLDDLILSTTKMKKLDTKIESMEANLSLVHIMKGIIDIKNMLEDEMDKKFKKR